MSAEHQLIPFYHVSGSHVFAVGTRQAVDKEYLMDVFFESGRQHVAERFLTPEIHIDMHFSRNYLHVAAASRSMQMLPSVVSNPALSCASPEVRRGARVLKHLCV